LNAQSELDMTESRLRVGGDVDFAQAANARSAAADSAVHLDGVGAQALHTDGADLGVPGAGGVGADHFAIGQLVVEGSGLPAQASLACEGATASGGALYLPGLSAAGQLGANPLGLDGLRVLNGSTLSLGRIQVYARIDGDCPPGPRGERYGRSTRISPGRRRGQSAMRP
jgi:hypothetical protein